MALIEINKDPPRSHLIWFGALLGLFLGLVGAILWWRLDTGTPSYVLWCAAVLVPALYYAVPPLRKPVYLGWIYATFPIGWTISFLLLAVVYYLVLTPVGLLLRLGGRDPLHRRLDRGAESYWVERPPPREASRYFRQF